MAATAREKESADAGEVRFVVLARFQGERRLWRAEEESATDMQESVRSGIHTSKKKESRFHVRYIHVYTHVSYKDVASC